MKNRRRQRDRQKQETIISTMCTTACMASDNLADAVKKK